MNRPGSKELLYLTQLAYTGDFIVPTPCWVSYIPHAQLIGKTVKKIPTSFNEEWRLSSSALRSQLMTFLRLPPPLIYLCYANTNYPGNPDGSSYSADQLRSIADVVRDHNLLVISDKIYSDLRIDGNDHHFIQKERSYLMEYLHG